MLRLLAVSVAVVLSVAACSSPEPGADAGAGGGTGGASGGGAGGGAGAGTGGATGGAAGGGTGGGTVDAGTVDAGSVDAGFDAGIDAGVDAGPVDAGPPGPSGLSYSDNPATYQVDVAVAPNLATVTAYGLPVLFSASSALPQGLSLDTATGTISGTPTKAAGRATYSVTAQTSAGSTTTGVSIGVFDAPSGFVYAKNPAVYGVGVAISPNVPSFDGGGLAVSFAVDGGRPLPRGLSLNASTGTVSGTPYDLTDAGVSVIVVSNSLGSAAVDLSIAVYHSPSSFSYQTDPATYVVGTAIPPNVPNISTGGAPMTFTAAASPAFPAGLTVDSSSGVISGTPTAAKGPTFYTINATNPVGATLTQVRLEVLSPATLTVQPGSLTPAVGVANFGPQTIAVSGATLYLANDGVGTATDACESIASGGAGAVVLADRSSSCTPRTQALRAQAAGAPVIIIIDDQTASTPPTLFDAVPGGVYCAAISVTKATGATLKSMLGSGAVTVSITR